MSKSELEAMINPIFLSQSFPEIFPKYGVVSSLVSSGCRVINKEERLQNPEIGCLIPAGAVSSGLGLALFKADDNMKLQLSTETVSVSDIRELDVNNSNDFRDQIRASMSASQRFIEIDLSETTFLDSCGLGALIALHKTTCSRNGLVRLLNPTPPVQQILELTRMHRIFEVVRR